LIKRVCFLITLLVLSGQVWANKSTKRGRTFHGRQAKQKLSAGDKDVRYELGSWQSKGYGGPVVDTDHFLIYLTFKSKLFYPRAALLAETLYEQLKHDFHGSPAIKIPVYIFNSREEWIRFTAAPQYASSDPLTLGEKQAERQSKRKTREKLRRIRGYASKRAVLYRRGGEKETFRVMAHEITHAYVTNCCSAALPSWLHEGLAGYYESHKWKQGKLALTPGRNELLQKQLRRVFRGSNRLIPLKTLISNSNYELLRNSPRQKSYHPQCWALFKFLKSRGFREKFSLDRLLRDIGSNRVSLPVFQKYSRSSRTESGRRTMPDIRSRARTKRDRRAGISRLDPDEIEKQYVKYMISLTGSKKR